MKSIVPGAPRVEGPAEAQQSARGFLEHGE
jgi:hypothetical protein